MKELGNLERILYGQYGKGRRLMPEGEDPEGQPKVQSSQYEFLKPTERFTYGCWRTDKPKEEGYSHEMISPDAMRLVQ